MKNQEAMMSSEDTTWETPPAFFDKLNEEFNFTLDPCATKKTAKCKKFYTEKDDGLSKDWGGEVVFCNPPYGPVIKHWVKKCSEEAKKKNTTVVMLIPSRTDTIYFHEYVYHKAKIRFIKGRLKFLRNKKIINTATFPSMIVIYK